MTHSPDKKNEVVVRGVPASQGIACGSAFVFIQSDIDVPEYSVEPAKRAGELARFERALEKTRQQIQSIRATVEKKLGTQEAGIFDAHLLVLEDQMLVTETTREFEKTSINIEACYNRVAQRYIQTFGKINDEYLRERAGDIRDVVQRVLGNLLGHGAKALSRLVDKRVVVANEISPTDAAGIDRSQALAIVTDSGSQTSHAAIVARSMKVPAVVGLRDLSAKAKADDAVLVDGYEGLVILNPGADTLERYRRIQHEHRLEEQRLFVANRLPAVTSDGVAIPLRANIESPDEIDLVRDYRASGVGLYRTEFLFLNAKRIPDEETQYAAYREIAEAMAPDPVVIRTLDVGGDKPMAGGNHFFLREANPFLGYRAIRFCLDQVDIFKAQLRAILRASAGRNVHLMYPMVSGRDELVQANALLEECKAELRAGGVPFDESMPVGSMIEIPSAACTVDLLAKECDFFSIGSNDLIQYLLAIDRVNERIAHLYEPTHPAVLRTFRHIADETHKAGLKVSLCGEVASDPMLVPLLLGLGVDELSMTPPQIPAVKFLLRSMTMADARRLAQEALAMEDPAAIRRLCLNFYAERHGAALKEL